MLVIIYDDKINSFSYIPTLVLGLYFGPLVDFAQASVGILGIK